MKIQSLLNSSVIDPSAEEIRRLQRSRQEQEPAAATENNGLSKHPAPVYDQYIPEDKTKAQDTAKTQSHDLSESEDDNSASSPEDALDTSVTDSLKEAGEEGRPAPVKEENEDEKASPKKDSPKCKSEKCTCNTDKVDREIERLKKKQKQLEQQINNTADPKKAEALEKELAQVEHELSQKDNDSYRRQHAVFS